jgi:predicted metal-dependent hydrolase
MTPPPHNPTNSPPDPRYLAGVEFFNAGEYFEAHEVWEELWHDCLPEDRRFYQSLIQAAVALYHFDRGNAEGANRLLARGRAKAVNYPDVYRGLAIRPFWDGVAATIEQSSPPPQIVLHPIPRDGT